MSSAEGKIWPIEAASRILGENISDFTPLGGGRNSLVWKATTSSGKLAVVKQYFRSLHDVRDRLGVEWKAFSFVQKHRPGTVPLCLGKDDEAGVAVYSFIHGEAPAVHNGRAEDVKPLLSFLSSLREIGALREAADLPNAADAVFTPDDILGQIRERLDKLSAQKLDGNDGPRHKLRVFLEEHLRPEFQRCANFLKEHGCKIFPSCERAVLSPSDFGFHNAVRRPDGNLVFVDFEYFGWDDPAKLIIDTIMHPHEHMSLSEAQLQSWLDGALKVYSGDATLPERLLVMAPLLRLKWALILLNEFSSVGSDRRNFSGHGANHARLYEQLRKSESMLLKKIEWGNFLR